MNGSHEPLACRFTGTRRDDREPSQASAIPDAIDVLVKPSGVATRTHVSGVAAGNVGLASSSGQASRPVSSWKRTAHAASPVQKSNG